MKPLKTQTHFLYTWTLAKGRLNVPTALGHMLMLSAQLHNCFAYFNQKINPWRIVFYFFILLPRLLSY